MKGLFCLMAAEHLSWWGRHGKGLCGRVRALSKSAQLTSEEARWNMQKTLPASASEAPPPRVPQPPQNSAPCLGTRCSNTRAIGNILNLNPSISCKTCLSQPSVAWAASERQWVVVKVLPCCQIIRKIC